MRLYVGNLSKNVLQEDLQTAFAAFGKIEEVVIVTDRGNGVSKGFAFVEMPVEEEEKAAIAGLHGTDLKGRSMDVNEAKPRVERSSRGGGRGNRSFGGGRRSY